MSYENVLQIRMISQIVEQIRGQMPKVIQPGQGQWHLRDGCDLFVNHPVKCPFCNEEIANNYIWLVSYGKVLRVWREGIPLSRSTYVHPHVDIAGNICFGGFERDFPAGPLFLGLYPGSSYINVGAWLRERLDHECEGSETEFCDLCHSRVSSDYWYGWCEALGADVCSDCYDNNTTYCAHCEETFATDDDNLIYIESASGYYCSPCTEANFTFCEQHNEWVRPSEIEGDYNDGAICSDCVRHQNLGRCDECDDLFPSFELQETRIGQRTLCTDCFPPEPEDEREDEDADV